MSQQKAVATVDHEHIRQWVEEHGGHPARVKGTGDEEDPGLLRIDFPGFSGEGRLEEISWDEFFQNRDWPVASALAVIMILILIVPIAVFNRYLNKEVAA